MPVRVLIVDEHPGFRALARQLLTRRGYEVAFEAAFAEAAVAAAARIQPDAVLVDVQIGAGAGFQAARAIKGACPRAAVLLVSNRDYAGCEELARDVGAVGFLLKSRLATEDLHAYWG